MLNQKKQFEQLTGGAITTAAPADVTSGQGMPTGNMTLSNLHLGINQALTIGTGTTPQTDGELLLVKSIFVNSDKHGTLVENLDGLSLHRMIQYIFGVRPQTTAYAASTASYYSGWDIPLAIPENAHAFRPYDSVVDLMNARLDTRVSFNTQTQALGTPGTASSIPTVTWSGHLNYSPKESSNPLEGELPLFTPVFKQRVVPISATTNQYQIPLDYGGLIYLAIGLHERNSSTFAEVSDILVPGAKIRLDVNGVDRVLPMEKRDLQSMAKTQCEVETTPAGFTFLDFFSKTGMLTDAINTINSAGSMNLYADVVTSANRELRVLTWGLKPLNDNAKRAVQLMQMGG